jgi:hypothetical protein
MASDGFLSTTSLGLTNFYRFISFIYNFGSMRSVYICPN